jgi:hypothetical protein
VHVQVVCAAHAKAAMLDTVQVMQAPSLVYMQVMQAPSLVDCSGRETTAPSMLVGQQALPASCVTQSSWRGADDTARARHSRVVLSSDGPAIRSRVGALPHRSLVASMISPRPVTR